MKIQLEVNSKKMARYAAIGIVLLAIGYVLGATINPMVGFSGGVGYLSTADLNRQDIQASILLTRFCEGLGLRSSVYWQKDAQGNVFGQPICLPPPQE